MCRYCTIKTRTDAWIKARRGNSHRFELIMERLTPFRSTALRHQVSHQQTHSLPIPNLSSDSFHHRYTFPIAFSILCVQTMESENKNQDSHEKLERRIVSTRTWTHTHRLDDSRSMRDGTSMEMGRHGSRD